MTINERIKALRLDLNKKQYEFAEKLGIGQAALSAIEHGERNVTDQNIILICRQFGIREQWLRHGIGEMFVRADSTILSRLKDEYDADDLDLQIVDKYLKLKSDKRQVIKEYILSVASSLQASAATVEESSAAAENSIAQELEDYRKELEAEKEAQTLRASQGTGENAAG
ncbi:MAG: helix-turn-helix transcriptional regulator [Ethanoligenens sp.]